MKYGYPRDRRGTRGAAIELPQRRNRRVLSELQSNLGEGATAILSMRRLRRCSSPTPWPGSTTSSASGICSAKGCGSVSEPHQLSHDDKNYEAFRRRAIIRPKRPAPIRERVAGSGAFTVASTPTASTPILKNPWLSVSAQRI